MPTHRSSLFGTVFYNISTRGPLLSLGSYRELSNRTGEIHDRMETLRDQFIVWVC